MKFRAIIFDLDGTLLNTLEDLANSMNSVLVRFGFPAWEVEKYKYFIGNGIGNLVRKVLPPGSCNEATVAVCLAAFREEYGRRWAEKTRPYDGIPELLDELVKRNMQMAVLSNKADNFTRQIVAGLLPRWKFNAVFGERSSVPKKPDPVAAIEIAQLFGIPAGNFLYLGDTGIDMKTANAAGMYAVGALWGFRNAEELLENGAKALIAKPQELLDLL